MGGGADYERGRAPVAIKLAVDAGEYERASAVLDVLRRTEGLGR